MDPVTNPLALLSHEVLSEVLVGSAGSPLRKALIDSGLGEDLSPATGLETDLREMIFAAGLRGTDPAKEDAVQALILQTLSDLADKGLDPGLVQSMVNRVEFRNREIRGNGQPYALRLMGRCLRGWTHGMDPVDSLAFTPAMEELKARIAAGSGYFEAMIRERLLENTHRVTLVVRPDPDQEAREQGEAAAALRSLEAGLTQAAEGQGPARCGRLQGVPGEAGLARGPCPRALGPAWRCEAPRSSAFRPSRRSSVPRQGARACSCTTSSPTTSCTSTCVSRWRG